MAAVASLNDETKEVVKAAAATDTEGGGSGSGAISVFLSSPLMV